MAFIECGVLPEVIMLVLPVPVLNNTYFCIAEVLSIFNEGRTLTQNGYPLSDYCCLCVPDILPSTPATGPGPLKVKPTQVTRDIYCFANKVQVF